MARMQTLYLLRHAKAEAWQPGVDDHARVLADRGRRHADALADWMHRELAPAGQVLCSPSARTRETLAPLLQRQPGLQAVTTFHPGIYEASTGQLERLAAHAFQHCSVLLMVGHNPGFEMLMHATLANGELEGIHKMATGTLAVMDFDPGWEQALGEGRLRHFVTRHDLGL